ncbi:RBR-type E3 ubiquitin transferase [Ranunculus cassubicifolius]
MGIAYSLTRNIFCSCFLYGDDSEDDIGESADTTGVVHGLNSDQDPTYKDVVEEGYIIVHNDVNEGGDGGGSMEDDTTTTHQLQGYTVLSEADIRLRLEKHISRISCDLSVSRVSAITLLCNYNWSARSVCNAWFADEEKVRSSVGLLKKPTVQYPDFKFLTCLICFERLPYTVMHAAACGHPFCTSCWRGYISTSIKDGPGCLTLTCPDPSCNAAVGQDSIHFLFPSNIQMEKYSRYLLRSYVESNKNIKWCPAPGCDYAVEYALDSASYDVCCKCTYEFCWNCCEEIHRPVHCSTVANWMVKNSADSENANWLLANSKPCPKCKRPIEKIGGCNHMTCKPPCKFQFCWLCLGGWSDHGDTCAISGCTFYGKYVKTEETKLMASTALARYARYYESWATNEVSRKKATERLERMPVMNSQCVSDSQIKFMTDAWLQIIEGRRVLKWSYAYGYYVPEDEHDKRKLLEKLQGMAESGLIRLQRQAEHYIDIYLSADCTSQGSTRSYKKLVDLTVVTRDYVESLVQALENNLADVDSVPTDE